LVFTRHPYIIKELQQTKETLQKMHDRCRQHKERLADQCYHIVNDTQCGIRKWQQSTQEAAVGEINGKMGRNLQKVVQRYNVFTTETFEMVFKQFEQRQTQVNEAFKANYAAVDDLKPTADLAKPLVAK